MISPENQVDYAQFGVFDCHVRTYSIVAGFDVIVYSPDVGPGVQCQLVRAQDTLRKTLDERMIRETIGRRAHASSRDRLRKTHHPSENARRGPSGPTARRLVRHAEHEPLDGPQRRRRGSLGGLTDARQLLLGPGAAQRPQRPGGRTGAHGGAATATDWGQSSVICTSEWLRRWIEAEKGHTMGSERAWPRGAAASSRRRRLQLQR